MPQQARSFITRERIVESAAVVFDRFGYAGSTLSDIVRQSGTTKGSVYFHFNSKEQVAAAVVSAQHGRSVGLEEALGGARGLEATIRLSHLLGHQIVNDPLVRAGIRLTLEQSSIMTSLANPYTEWIALVHRFLQQAVENGDVRSDLDCESAANVIVGSFTGVQMLSEVITGRADLPKRLVELWNLLLPAFVPARKVPHFQRINVFHAE